MPQIELLTIEPLTRKTTDGRSLVRPDLVEREIAEALAMDDAALLAPVAARVSGGDGVKITGFTGAAESAGAAESLSSECLVFLIRRDLRRNQRRWADRLLPTLLGRCQKSLRGSVRGFDGTSTDDVREEVLGRLVELLLDPGNGADFFEVRFALAFKRLTIDVCRRARRRAAGQLSLDGSLADDSDGLEGEIVEAVGSGFDAEDLVFLRQALASLDDEERRALVLHYGMGVGINPRQGEEPGLVSILGLSERTVRNRLRRAEAKVRALKEKE